VVSPKSGKKVIRLKGRRRINKYGWNKSKLFLSTTEAKWKE
jgi:hypothetical protein